MVTFLNNSTFSAEMSWHSLSPDLQEHILLLLPISAAIKLAAVCKPWYAIIGSRSFSARLSLLPSGKRPWFFIWGINELIHNRSAAFAFDPIVGHWFRLKITRPPDFNRASLCGANGGFFAFSGSKVCFNPTPSKLKWKETSPAVYTRCSALMGTIGSPHSQSFKLVTVGGIIDDGDHRVVEIYDSCTDTWECCESFPDDGVFDGISSHWMTVAVLGQKFYVADYNGHITDFDVGTKSWSKVKRLRVPDLVSLFIIAGDAVLYAVGVCRSQKGEALKIFKVNNDAMACEEVGSMPEDLFSLFENAGEQKGASLKCVGSGGLLYVYSTQYYKGYPVCMCDLSEGSFVWRQLPCLPSPPRFDRVVCCSTTVTPRAYLVSM